MITTLNPYTGQKIKDYQILKADDIDKVVEKSGRAFKIWREEPVSERAELLRRFSEILLQRKEEYAELITREMGKPISQSIAEIEKCVWVCDFYAHNAESFLSDALIKTDAEESFISYDPQGPILAIMPWNFPFWQVIRFAAPTLTAGNTVILKHAGNTSGCGMAIEKLFQEAGYPAFCFQTVICDHKQVEQIIGNEDLRGVSLTGSESAGRIIAGMAGKHLKKSVLELGGNNACIVWEDADLDSFIPTMIQARMQNTGQSCIAAKRFIVVESIYDRFIAKFKKGLQDLNSGDPMSADTDIGVLARTDLADTLEKQVRESVNAGARVTFGNGRKGTYYEPTLLEDVKPGMPAFEEELFGPVAAIMRAADREEALSLAARSRFGLGTMLFTQDLDAARRAVGAIPDGAFFINEMVKSDPRLPFGGTKASGYGRELSKEGMLEFVNKKTVYIGK